MTFQMQEPVAPGLTVIVCTFNRADILQECIQSLFEQDAPESVFSILIIDNNSTDDTGAVVRRLSSTRENLDLVQETTQGLSHARNRGLREARTEWVAYLDDDAIANNDWVSRILLDIDTLPFDAFGGPYLPWYRDGKVDWYRDEYGTNLSWMPYGEITELESRHFSGGNAVYRREAALAAGGFPTDCGMQGEELGYGEENILQDRLRERGHRIGFDPGLIIQHSVPMKKQTLSWFSQRRITEGREYVRQHQVPTGPLSFLRHLLIYGAVDVRNLSRALWRFAFGDYRKENIYVEVVPQLLFQREVLRTMLSPRKQQP